MKATKNVGTPESPDPDLSVFKWSFVSPRYLPSWMLLGSMRLITLCPLPVLWALGWLIGETLYRFGHDRRHIANRNIERCLPELSTDGRQGLVREHFHAVGLGLLAMPLPWWASRRRLTRLVRYQGRHHYDQALAAGKNIILLAPHFMGLESGLIMSTERPMMYMYQRPKNILIDTVIQRGRTRFGAELIERSGSLKGMFRKLKGGVPLCYLPDQNPGAKRGIFVNFMGVTAATHQALGRFAKLADAVVIPCICTQRPFGRGYLITYKPPLENFPSGDPEKDTTHMNQAIEKAVRDDPAQYFWIHRRFKIQPEGEPDFYS
ncbi:MAG: lipid A biosynthesis acyltransferase [Gammaproteobacteria bacterium]|nr:lipid A biosynthesis acyltransferase [Gammaproteobacteria bacterium]